MNTSGMHVQAHEKAPPTMQVEQSVVAIASQVKALIRKRREIALTLRRTHDETNRAELDHIDQDLQKHGIDIPAIKQQVAMRKR